MKIEEDFNMGLTEFTLCGVSHTRDSEYEWIKSQVSECKPDIVFIEVQENVNLYTSAEFNSSSAALLDSSDVSDDMIVKIDKQPDVPPESLISNDILTEIGLNKKSKTLNFDYDSVCKKRAEMAEKCPDFLYHYGIRREEHMIQKVIDKTLGNRYSSVLLIAGSMHIPPIIKGIKFAFEY